MKKLSIVALSASLVVAPAFAEVNSYTMPMEEMTQTTDLSFAFDNVENLQVTDMTLAEMQETEGAWANFAIGAGIGAVGGHFSYMSGAIANDSYNWKAHAIAVGVGAGTGLLNPVSKASHLINGMRGVVAATTGSAAVGYAGRK